MKLPRKYAPLIFNVVMSALMALVMSFAMLVINAGFVPGFFGLWFESFVIGFAVALPATFAAVPIAKRLVHSLTA